MRNIVLKTLNLLAYEKIFIISFCCLLYVCSSGTRKSHALPKSCGSIYKCIY